MFRRIFLLCFHLNKVLGLNSKFTNKNLPVITWKYVRSPFQKSKLPGFFFVSVFDLKQMSEFFSPHRSESDLLPCLVKIWPSGPDQTSRWRSARGVSYIMGTGAVDKKLLIVSPYLLHSTFCEHAKLFTARTYLCSYGSDVFMTLLISWSALPPDLGLIEAWWFVMISVCNQELCSSSHTSQSTLAVVPLVLYCGLTCTDSVDSVSCCVVFEFSNWAPCIHFWSD